MLVSLNKQPKYRFYATLLNAYSWYLDSESETAFQEFIDKINRVPFSSEAADRGTAFNTLIDGIKDGVITTPSLEDEFEYGGFKFSSEIAFECAEYVQHGISQVRENGFIDTPLGLIEVYGDMDYILPAMEQVDLKTTKAWELGKYASTWQHIVYPYCYNQKTGFAPTFTYLATDFKSVVKEQYIYNHERDEPKLRTICVDLAQFIEQHRALITDLKIFNLHSEAA
jgi:hypothetical protein